MSRATRAENLRLTCTPGSRENPQLLATLPFAHTKGITAASQYPRGFLFISLQRRHRAQARPSGAPLQRRQHLTRGVRNETLWNLRLHQSALGPENLTTLAHFSVSSAMSFPKSAGEPGSTVAPKSAKRALIMGSARPAFTSLLSTSMIAAGVLRR